MNVGFIGLGRMGMPMARDLLEAGFPLTVHNRSRGKVEEMSRLGAIPASSPAEVTQGSDIVLTCLPDVPTVEQVFLGERGIVPSAQPGQVLVDHSTIGPSTARRIAEAAEARRAYFLDAPLIGKAGRDTGATLNIIVGGERSAYEKALPVLQAMAINIQYLGPSGTGSTMKLVVNLMACTNCLVAAEGFLLAVRLGVDPQIFLDLSSKSYAQSRILSYMGPVMLSRDFKGNQVPLRLPLKDLGLVHGVAREVGVPLLAGTEALRIFQDAASKGLEEQDLSSILLVLEEMADKGASE